MQLWMAAVILAGVFTLSVYGLRRGRGLYKIAAGIGAGVLSPALLGYIVLTLVFVTAVGGGEPPAQSGVSSAVSVPEPPQKPALPADYDLPLDEVPALDPDVLGVRELTYEAMPTFGTQNETTKYVLHNLLHNRLEMEFYLTKDFSVDEGTGYGILSAACETAMSYYLFGAYTTHDMYTLDEDDKVRAKVKLIYKKTDYDREARAEALEFVLKNPVPAGGFRDFEAEKAYARKIHDFIARKVTYSPIGYAPEEMFGLERYEAYQEAYNVLAEDQNTAVCAGYARGFALIAHYAGINAAWVYGNETETQSHAWNLLYPCDGSEPVVIDVTWDDTSSEDVPGQHAVSDAYFYIPHSWETEHVPSAEFEAFLAYVNEK